MTNTKFWAGYQPGLRFARAPAGTAAFFEEVDAYRYATEPHIPEVVQFERWAGRRVLEAGCGMATDGARFAVAGAQYTGVDLSPTALDLARRRFALQGLPGNFSAASVARLPFADATFDLVFSHGVIHHIADTPAAAREFLRVLKPGGVALVMVYHRRSFNYFFTILVLRRLLALLLYVPGAVRLVSRLTREPAAVVSGHRALLREHGLRYLADRSLFLSNNTDGPGNPLSKAYTREELRSLFSHGSSSSRTEVRYLNLRLYPLGERVARWRPARWLERRIGWHLYVEVTKEGSESDANALH